MMNINSFSQFDSTSWSNTKIIEMTSSPFYFGDQLPGQLRQIAVSINAMQWIIGGWNLGLPVPPISEDYFKLFKDAFNVYQVSAGYSSDSLLIKLDEYCNIWSTFFTAGDKSLQGLKTFLNSQKMKAVRARDRNQLASINNTLTLINGSIKYAQTLNTLLQTGGSLRECLTILVRATQPLIVYDGCIIAVEALLKYQNEIPGELSAALSDIDALIRNEKNSFLVNLSNQKIEMVNTILNLGNFIYANNEKFFLNGLSKYLGSKNVTFLHDMIGARDVYKSLLQPLLRLDSLAKNINPAIHSAMADQSFNHLIFGSIRQNADLPTYKNCIRFLMLVEAVNCYRIGSLLTAACRIQDFSGNARDAMNIGNACLSVFKFLQTHDEQAKIQSYLSR
ncbi:MAG: hypothetical protein NTX61_03175 [Bacteroidetes bacterium]|nr:hypothetical protein [Bacteroidota bacterium]